MAYNKATGQSEYYIKFIQDFWNNPTTDYFAWHTTLLRVIYKGKGDPQDPNNSQGIALKETSAKILSIILARRLLKRFKEINPISQFGHSTKFTEVDYTTGVHQGDNMSSVLFLFVIQAFLDTLKLQAQPVQYAFFPENKNGNLATIKGRLLSQNTSAKEHHFFLILLSTSMTVSSYSPQDKNSNKPSKTSTNMLLA